MEDLFESEDVIEIWHGGFIVEARDLLKAPRLLGFLFLRTPFCFLFGFVGTVFFAIIGSRLVGFGMDILALTIDVSVGFVNYVHSEGLKDI
jgi:hypothetical protein